MSYKKKTIYFKEKHTYGAFDIETTMGIPNPKYKKGNKECKVLLDKNNRPRTYSICLSIIHKNSKSDFSIRLINKMIQEERLYIDHSTKHDLTLDHYYFISPYDFIELLYTAKYKLNILTQNGAKFDWYYMMPFFLEKFNYKVKFDLSLFSIEKGLNCYVATPYLHQFYKHLSKHISKDTYDKFNKDYNLAIANNDENLLHTILKSIKKEYNKSQSMDFTYLFTSDKGFLYVELILASNSNGKYTRTISIRFFDCLRIFTASIKIKGKALGFDKLEKDDDYQHRGTYKNIDEFLKDGSELEYVKRDNEIALIHFYKNAEKMGFKNVKLTAGSTAYDYWENLFINITINNLLDKKIIEKPIFKNGTNFNKGVEKYVIIKDYKKFGLVAKFLRPPYKNRIVSKKDIIIEIFDYYFPTDWLLKIDTYNRLRTYYVGGLVHVNELYRGVDITKENPLMQKIVKERNLKLYNGIGYHYDINSSYPAEMNSNIKAPYGLPLKSLNKKKLFNDKYYSFLEIIPKKDIEFKKYLPFLQNIGTPRSWVNVLLKNQFYYLSSVEFDWLIKILDIKNLEAFEKDFDYRIDFQFNALPMKFFFGEFVSYWYDKKQDINYKPIAKLFLNSLYGKFATKAFNVGYIYDPNKIGYKEYNLDIDPKYLPIGIAITAAARIALARSVGDQYDYFAYCDTDSVFLLSDKNLKFIPDNKKIGAMKLEFESDYALFRRGKQYVEYNNTLKKVKCAFSGINFDNEAKSLKISKYDLLKNIIGPSKFKNGTTLHYQTSKILIPGARVLFTDNKEILPMWKYPKLQQQTTWYTDKNGTCIKEVI